MHSNFQPYKLILFFLCLFSISISSGALAAYYVAPRSEVPVRRGPGNEYKIIAIIKDGTKVELLEEGGKWAKVLLKNGKEGWILRRYLTTKKPLTKIVTAQQQQIQLLNSEKNKLIANLDEAQKKYKQCQEELKTCIDERNAIQKDYQALVTDASNVVELRKALTETTTELNKLKQDFTTLEQENLHLKNNERIKWFLAGGGVLLIGWVLGMIMAKSRQRRRPSLL